MTTLSRRAMAGLPLALVAASAPQWASAAPRGFTSVRNFGALGDGATDDTDAIVRAHNAGVPLFYPRARPYYRISSGRIPVTASVRGDKAEIRLKQDGTGKTIIFLLQRCPGPLTISGMILDGEWAGEALGEASFGIVLGGCSNVTVTGNTIRNIYGDCIELSGDKQRVIGQCTDIRITNNILQNARRSNIATMSVDGLRIAGNRIESRSTYGAGIDVEILPVPISVNRNIAIADNTFDVAGTFTNLTKSNSSPVQNVSIAGNTGTCGKFLNVNPSANAQSLAVSGNRFRCAGPDKVGISIRNARGLSFGNNIDQTGCTPGYRTLAIADSELTATAGLDSVTNKFCG